MYFIFFCSNKVAKKNHASTIQKPKFHGEENPDIRVAYSLLPLIFIDKSLYINENTTVITELITNTVAIQAFNLSFFLAMTLNMQTI